ncbi:chaP protein [Streptomyces mashuensis]|uniref:ChaP protein n=1 Tax=Streptomyces mashuensis TaxID=33904 RepID=A0A919B2S7_9ACTN|nr:VOC family protein [Streptomyces mashuensis]GHF46481.1 chaP protein [Streptomyces mashuensis]
MPVRLDHTVVNSSDRFVAARFFAELIGAPEPAVNGPFAAVVVENGVTIDYADHFIPRDQIQMQHLAYHVSDEEFDAIHARVVEKGLEYWADPYHKRSGELNAMHGGRGFYVNDPDGHNLEFFTRTAA